MPVYNAGEYLVGALDSILAQTFRNWELILINDGSTDNSEDVIMRYAQYEDNRIYYIRNTENLQLIKTLNKGIGYCQGEYIARMDADDVCFPDRLRVQVEFLDSHPDYLMCGTNAIVINNKGKKNGQIRNLPDNDYLQVNMLFSPPFIHPSVMVRREVLVRNPYNEAYKHVEDYDLWRRIARQGKIANLGKDLLAYRWHDNNVSALNDKVQDELKDRIICEQLGSLGIEPTEEELCCHKITFCLYKMGHRQDVSVSRSEAVSAWFTKLLQHNRVAGRYDQDYLKVFLWARWAVLCISQKRYLKILSPPFASYHPDVLVKFLKLLLYLERK
jgi:glycosyltransferase involved in cell wall biosynthesis